MVELGKRPAFLVLDSEDGQNRRLVVCDNLQEVLRNWNAATRFSPIHPLAGREVLSHGFKGAWNLLFFGPCHPFDFVNSQAIEGAMIWFSLGLYNVLHATQNAAAHAGVKCWISEHRLSGECWLVEDGIVMDVELISRAAQEIPEDVRSAICQFPYDKAADAVRPSLLEYLPLMSAALHRSSLFEDGFLQDLQQFQRTVGKTLGDCGSDLGTLERLNLLTVVNAGLSHFCSQAFSGTSPITESLSHFWSHSLLSIGIGNLALWKMKSFIEDCFWAGAIPERLEAYEAAPPIDVEAPERADLWKKDYLQAVPEKEIERGEVVRSIAYFSGRDGFRSSRCTISAPLASVDACNSQKWNLLTMTHELIMDESGSGQRADVGNLDSLGRANLVGHQGDNGNRVAIGPTSVLTFDTFQQRKEGKKDVWSSGFRPATRAVP